MRRSKNDQEMAGSLTPELEGTPHSQMHDKRDIQEVPAPVPPTPQSEPKGQA